MPAEFAVYSACRDHLRQPTDSAPEPAAELLTALRLVYRRNHSRKSRQLRKSDLLGRGLSLLAREELYPMQPSGSTQLLEPRLELLIEILDKSPQRPVRETCGLVCLEQELEEQWSARLPRLVDRIFEIAEREEHCVLPLLVLLLQIDEPRARKHYRALKKSKFDEKRLRLAELVGILETWSGPKSFEPIVRRTYFVLFANLSGPQKARMAGRLFRELRREGSLRRGDRFKLLLDPLLARNPSNLSILEHLFELMWPHPGELASPYMLHYLDRVRAIDPDAVDPRLFEFARDKGSRHFIPRLSPIANEPVGRLFGLPSRDSRVARQAMDAIIDREGLRDAAGSLSVVEDDGGELSLSLAGGGDLAMSSAVEDGPPISVPTPMPNRARSAVVAVILGAILALGSAAALLLSIP